MAKNVTGTKIDVLLIGMNKLIARRTVEFESPEQKKMVNPQVDDLLIVGNPKSADDQLRVATVVNTNSSKDTNGWVYVFKLLGYTSSEVINQVAEFKMRRISNE